MPVTLQGYRFGVCLRVVRMALVGRGTLRGSPRGSDPGRPGRRDA